MRIFVVVATSAVKLNVSQWLLARKLSRPALFDILIALSRAVLIRVYAATVCLVSMLLAAWLGAVARTLATDHWHVLRTLDGAILLAASRDAGEYQAGLLPVLLVWAIMLIFTPTGFTIAFRFAMVAAGILGYRHFSPPPFAVTNKLVSESYWLTRFDDYCSRNAPLYLIVSIAVAYLLICNVTGMFGRLDGRTGRASSGGFARTLCAALLALLVLLLTGWAATVIRLGGGQDAGAQGGVYQGEYLLVLALLAFITIRVSNSGGWLTGAVLVTSMYALDPASLTLPAALRYAVGNGLFTCIGNAWGADALWAALFLYVPASVLGIYLVSRLRG